MENNSTPLILVSNDDGVSSKGITELIKFLRPLGEIVVMAPDAPRSGSGCAITVTQPVRYELVSEEPGLTVYRCSGTPTDCVKLARHTVLSRRPDLVVGGINHGDNSAANVHYSGTMGIVIEGCLNGIPSIGFSLCNHSADADFSPCGEYVRRIAGMVLKRGLPPLTCLNVNFPDLPSYKGIRVCRQTKGTWESEWIPCPRFEGDHYFWISGEFVQNEPVTPANDHWALDNGYIAITPTTVDVTDYAFIDELSDSCAKLWDEV